MECYWPPVSKQTALPNQWFEITVNAICYVGAVLESRILIKHDDLLEWIIFVSTTWAQVGPCTCPMDDVYFSWLRKFRIGIQSSDCTFQYIPFCCWKCMSCTNETLCKSPRPNIKAMNCSDHLPLLCYSLSRTTCPSWISHNESPGTAYFLNNSFLKLIVILFKSSTP